MDAKDHRLGPLASNLDHMGVWFRGYVPEGSVNDALLSLDICDFLREYSMEELLQSMMR